MKCIQVNKSDLFSGAARAAYRIHHALLSSGIDSRFLAEDAASGDWTVDGPESSWGKFSAFIKPHVAAQFRLLYRTSNPVAHSPAIIPSGWPKWLSVANPDIIHLHWINGEMLSIRQIGHLTKTVIWTLHDMWAFCGAEHYTEDRRWQEGYHRSNRPAHESGFDINRWTWERKRRHWQRPFHIVTPSRWLGECVKASVLMRDWPITVIPNPLDTNRWQPIEQALARQMLHLPQDVPLLLFGAMGGSRDSRKGFDILEGAIRHLRDNGYHKDMELVIFGQLAPKNPPDLGFNIHYTGHLHDDLTLQMLYSAVDVLIVPSRLEAFGQTASEAHACGTPVVAFNNSGVADIVLHQQTGYLARAFDEVDLANGILWVINNTTSANLRQQARDCAVKHFSYSVVAEQYLKVYRRALDH